MRRRFDYTVEQLEVLVGLTANCRFLDATHPLVPRVGVDYAVGPGFLAGDVRFIYSSLDTPLTGGSNAGSVSIAAGYRFVF